MSEPEQTIALYARVSTGTQEVALQIEAAEAWAPSHGYVLGGVYTDPAKSGTIVFAERPAGRRLLADIRVGTVHNVLVYKWDRLGRDEDVGKIETRQAVLDIERAGATLKSITQPIDTSTPMGRMMQGIEIDMGTMERRNILERSSGRISQIAGVAGRFLGGHAAYGYTVDGQERDARLIIDDDPIDGHDISPAGVVRLIYRWIGDEEKTTVWVAKELNRRNIPTRYAMIGRNKGAIWRPTRVGEMIKNTAYKGTALYGRRKSGKSPFPVPLTEREVPALIDAELWERAQAQLGRNRKRSKRNRKRDYLLSGLVTCGACGSTYTGLAYETKSGEERRYYTCNNVHQRHNTGGAPCHNPALSWPYEEAIWADIESWLDNPGPILDELAEQMNADQPDDDAVARDLQRKRRELAGQDGQRERILTAYRKELLDDDELESQLQAIRQEAHVLEDEIAALEATQQRYEDRRAELLTAAALLEELRERRRDGLSFEIRRRVVEALVKEIVICEDGTPAVTYRFTVIDHDRECRMATAAWAAPASAVRSVWGSRSTPTCLLCRRPTKSGASA